MSDVSLAVAFAAGVLSFISPCVLALVPVYLAFLGNPAVGATPDAAADLPRAVLLPQALLFIGGFSVVFIVLGTSIGLVGAPLFRIPEARQVAGIAVIVVGILTTGVFGPVLDRFSVGVDASALPAARGLRAAALGGLVAIGWTPCIGPVLGAILGLAATSADLSRGMLLLAVYSAGLAVPFLIAAVAVDRFLDWFQRFRKYLPWVMRVSGALLVVVGVLLLTGEFTRMAGWLQTLTPDFLRGRL